MVEPGKGSIDFTAMHKALDECAATTVGAL